MRAKSYVAFGSFAFGLNLKHEKRLSKYPCCLMIYAVNETVKVTRLDFLGRITP